MSINVVFPEKTNIVDEATSLPRAADRLKLNHCVENTAASLLCAFKALA